VVALKGCVIRLLRVSSSTAEDVLSQKWDHLPSVRYAHIHTEQRYCLYCMFATVWVLGDISTKLAAHLAESHGLYAHTKINYSLHTDWHALFVQRSQA